jgi:hypothetical protein
MTPSIPASVLANVVPGVLSAGGSPLSLNSVYLTSDTSIPIGTVQPFPSYAQVAAWFGATAPESVVAAVYFAGYTNCTVLPSTLYFAQANSADVAAYLRGASVAALSLAQIQALSGTISLSIDGVAQVSSAINLSSATGPSNAATIITTGLQNAAGRFSGTGSQAAGVVTISATASGSIAVGDTLVGAVESDTVVLSFGTYTALAGTGTLNVSSSGTVGSGAVTVSGVGVCTYDSQRQAFVITSPTSGIDSSVTFPAADSLTSGLFLTSTTGAVISPGAPASVPANLMNQIVGITQNWATFMTVAEVALSVKEAYAAWVQTTNQRYLYVCQDSDALVLLPDASSSFGPIIDAAGDTGVMPVYDNSGTGVIAALQTAIAASINFNQQNGRTTFAFRGQAGLAAQITNETAYENLIANGYNCYAAFATADQQFTLNQPGQISGPFLWADTYINQIFLNSQFQLALMNLLASVPAVPYVTRGYNLIRSALLTPIAQALNFGTIVAGVQLSGSQSASLNSATGDLGATATIQNTGWYLQILDPGSIVRGQRGTPVINFWYTDGGSIQKISMSSIDVL